MRYVALVDDPVAGGSTLEDLIDAGSGTEPEWVAPSLFIPASAGQVDPGLSTLDRNDEVRGRRANTAPVSFASAPSATFTARAYPKLTTPLIRKALSGTPSTSGVAPAAIATTVGPIQSGDLMAFQYYLMREGQLDRVSGAVVDELSFNFPVDGEGTVDVTLAGLYHDVDVSGSVAGLPAPTYPGFTETFMLRDVKAYLGEGAGTQIDCLAGFGWTWNNGLIDDFRSRFCAGKNVETTVLETVRHKLWYPNQHKIGPQTVTGRLDFGDVRPDRELRRILAHAEKLVVELSAGPITPATTPAADEMIRLTFYKTVLTGGGADPLTREGDQVSSYEFTAYLDETPNKDVEATFVAAAAIP